MKARNAHLFRTLLRLVEDDVRAIADQAIEIDEREAAHWRNTELATLHADTAIRNLDERLRRVENLLAAELHANPEWNADTHSRKVPS